MDVEFDVGGTMSHVSEPHDLAATSLFYVFGLAALALLSLGLLVWTSLEPYTNLNGTFIAVAVFWVGFSTSAWGIYRTCYRVEVSDGYLVMRYLYRRRVVRLERSAGSSSSNTMKTAQVQRSSKSHSMMVRAFELQRTGRRVR